jgi:two-component system phosphate regulon sensor histidine kinase PhoR
VDNAAKYSKENKFIELKTVMYKGRPAVEVIDNGIGIAKADQQKIFEKFFRVSTGLVHDTKGTGLGLTIVKHVLDAHKAEIELESEEGKGATFRIIFSVDKINFSTGGKYAENFDSRR